MCLRSTLGITRERAQLSVLRTEKDGQQQKKLKSQTDRLQYRARTSKCIKADTARQNTEKIISAKDYIREIKLINVNRTIQIIIIIESAWTSEIFVANEKCETIEW